MENKYKKIPFNLDLAKEITFGTKEGRIVSRIGLPVKMLYHNLKTINNRISIMCVVSSDVRDCNGEHYEFAYIYNNKEGKFNSELQSKYDLFIEIPYKHRFKEGDVICRSGTIGIFREAEIQHEDEIGNFVLLTYHCIFDGIKLSFRTDFFPDDENCRLATTEEKQMLTDALKRNCSYKAIECLNILKNIDLNNQDKTTNFWRKLRELFVKRKH